MAKSSSLKTTIVLATLQVIALAHTPLVQRDEKPIKLVIDLVMVDATVTDKDGRFIRNLKTEDFVIYEDGEAQKIDFFEATEEASLTASLAVVVAIDTSGSIKPEEIARQREATESFVKLVRPESLFAIIAFNSEIRVLQDFTSDARKISRAFQRLGEVGGSSRIFGSIDRAISMLKRGPRFRNGRRLRRVVIVLTDGYDNVSPPEQSEMIRRANIYSRISAEVRAQYVLTYYSNSQVRDGRFQAIAVRVKRPGLQVRSHRGYHASTSQ